jgi:hypothetical protein
MLQLRDRGKVWGATAAEVEARFPCDDYLPMPFERFTRAIDIAAPPEIVFRWLCQLKVAPYSYDWIDNRGRRSPRELTPGVERLASGQRFLVFEIVGFEPGQQLSGLVLPRFRRLYGPLAGTYAVAPRPAGGSRLVVRLDVGAASTLTKIRRELLSWGDLIMMRKQLRTLRGLAERDACRIAPPRAG